MTTTRGPADCWLIDMDGVLVHENHALPGAADFLARLVERGRRFLVLTNNSIFTPRDLAARLAHSGLTVPEGSIWTSALATADFLASQLPGGSAFVIGETGLTTAMHEAGYTQTDTHPDYVVLGETRTLSFSTITKAIRLVKEGARFIATNPDATSPSSEGPLPATGSVAAMITKAIRLVKEGARFIATNPDATSPSAEGPLPATGSVAAMITKATGAQPYFVGKPNPMMFRSAMNRIQAHAASTVMVGDRMDTDVVAGIEAGLETLLVLTGSTKAEDVARYPFRPTRVLNSIADAVALV